MLRPRPLFFSSGGDEGVTFVWAGGGLALLPLVVLVLLLLPLPLALPLASLGFDCDGEAVFSVLSGLVAGEGFSVPGVVTVRLGL